MLKHRKVLFITFVSLFLIGLSINSGLCVDALAQHTPELAEPVNNLSLKYTVFKFLKVMAGVVLSSVIIFTGLTLYNKFFVKKISLKNNGADDVLATPKTIDNAIAFFIKRNKM